MERFLTPKETTYAEDQSERYLDYYEQQGAGEPLILIPFLSADNACHAFQVAEYSKHFTCVSTDPRDAGESDKPAERTPSSLP